MAIIFNIACLCVMTGLVLVAAEIESYSISAALVLTIGASLMLASVLTLALSNPGRAVLRMLSHRAKNIDSEEKQERLFGKAWLVDNIRKQTALWSMVGFGACIWAFAANFDSLNYFGPGLTTGFLFLVLGYVAKGGLTILRDRITLTARGLAADVPYDSASLQGGGGDPTIFPLSNSKNDLGSAS